MNGVGYEAGVWGPKKKSGTLVPDWLVANPLINGMLPFFDVVDGNAEGHDQQGQEHAHEVGANLTDNDEHGPQNGDSGGHGEPGRGEGPTFPGMPPTEQEDAHEGGDVEAVDREDTEVGQPVGVEEENHDAGVDDNRGGRDQGLVRLVVQVAELLGEG